MKLKQGLVQIYTGDGKGKTTAAFGLALRAVGAGLKVCVIQFLKGCTETGEVIAAQRFSPQLEVTQWGRKSKRTGQFLWVNLKKPSAQDLRLICAGLSQAREACASGAWDMVILDEFNLLVKHGLIPEAEALGLIKQKHPQTELILTGRGATPRLIRAADLVSRMQDIKHPGDTGYPARQGVEY